MEPALASSVSSQLQQSPDQEMGDTGVDPTSRTHFSPNILATV